ncbi:M48 family metallopeptidase [Alteromonas sp. a30]|uniref:M48 family metallopeptidase n=1 Tax=Alteromonas sp. a30 TaxID=2730917 RepID=UPI002281800C|nr:M48 family metallopeptidase [Alteromonas sp. a30]MCY7297372.1 M48 family metallopeptidase [Alteromonas sp. a30]
MSKGQLYLAGKSTCIPVSLVIEDGTLFIYQQDTQAFMSAVKINEVESPSRLAGVPREIKLPDGALLSVLEQGEVDDWLDGEPRHSVFKLEKSNIVVVLSLLAIPLTLIATFKYLIPALAITFANWVPDSAVKIASQHTLYLLDKSTLEPSELKPETQETYIAQWQTLIEKLNLDSTRFNIQFRHAQEMGPNAFALPDGTMIITDELVTLVNHDMNLLTAILLHEIGHVEHKHSMRLIAKTLGSSLIINFIFGDVSALIEAFGGFSSTVIQNQFSRELEWEADNYAITNLEQLGMDKENFALAMESLADLIGEQSGFEQLLSSHPAIQERIENARTSK